MSIQGFKNLMKVALFTDDSFQPLLKKNEEYKKITQLSIDHFQSIAKNFQSFETAYHKIIHDYDQETELAEQIIPQYYHEYIQLYRNIQSEQRFFCEKLANNFKELTALCNNIFTNYSNLILTFQGLIRSYKSHEQILFQLSKKYFRTQKTMINNIQSYKSSFTDVKLIYNMDQKNKRFNACEGTFKNLMEELEAIEDKLKQINQEKQQIADSYVEISKQFKITLKTIGNKLIAMAKLFLHDFCQMQKTMITYLAEKKFTLEKIELKSFFNHNTKIRDEDYFNVVVDRSKCEILPSFIVYSKNIKEESYHGLGKLIIAYVKELEFKIQQRMQLNKKILEFTSIFLKLYQKSYYLTLKEVMSNYEKMKKKLSQIFGNRLNSFLKSNISVFDITIGINQKFIKRTPAKLKIVETSLSEENKMLEIFIKELRSNIDKFLKKKQIKKVLEGDHDSNEFTEQEPANADLSHFKNEFTDISDYLTHLIEGFVQKIKKLQDQIKFQYNAFVNDLSISTNEIYSLCCEYQELYFGEADFLNNFKKYEADIDKTLQTQSKFFEEINFGILLKQEETQKVTFDAQINKVEEYKKIKKPIQIQIEEQNIKQYKELTKKKDNISDVQSDGPERKGSGDKTGIKESVYPSPEKIQVNKDKDKDNKYEEFITNKIAFLPQEKFYKTFSCGLSDKIILTGRLYITNKRLCFHSKFNTNNVFFGETFMQIPRKDIKKIEKRYNAIVFDNSISITTIHGQVFLTSFFSRNQAFDLICSALDINSEEVMFEPEEIKQDENVDVKPMEQDDDIKEETLNLRRQNLERSLTVCDYKELYKSQISFPCLDALKFFKLFQLGLEFSYNRKNYKSWISYFKDVLEHKDSDLGEWTPSIAEYLNSSNIKENTPERFSKKINCNVPISNSGVPFMPKFTKSQENISLFIFSKDKYIVQSIIQNSGVPYSDTFNLKLKKVIESKEQGKCTMTVSMYINFFTSTMMKSIIESKSTEETKNSFIKYDDEIKKYLRYLDKLKNRQMKISSSEGERQIKDNGLSEEYEKEITELRQSQQQLKNELKSGKNKFQQNKKLLLGSLILNILLILILIS